MMGDNKIVIAAAGSGKTTYLVREALKVRSERVLITTYTESNEAEIRQKFFELIGHVPRNVVIMTWFSFLITHGVKPFQGGLFEFQVTGMQLVTSQSAVRYHNRSGQPVPWGEEDHFEKHYFDTLRQVYSDKLPKLTIRCNDKSGGAVIDRISRIFPHVFVDEVQDLAGYDLSILSALARSPARLLMVGDPRQVTYLTHHENKFKKYADGGIANFLRNELPKSVPVEIDETSLNTSHRNSALICSVSSRLYPDLPASSACECEGCRGAEPPGSGIFILKTLDYGHYLATVRPMQLRQKIDSRGVDPSFPVMNFGEAKGRGFNHVVVLPTEPMRRWLVDPTINLTPGTRAKLYVAMTRARYSVAIAMDWDDKALPDAIASYQRST